MDRYKCTICKDIQDLEKNPPLFIRNKYGFPIICCIKCWEWGELLIEGEILTSIFVPDDEYDELEESIEDFYSEI